MKIIKNLLTKKTVIFVLSLVLLFGIFMFVSKTSLAIEATDACGVTDENRNNFPACTSVDVGELGFQIPSLGDILTFVIRAFFVIAGLAALFYMLLGAFAWVTSGGDSEAVGAAQQKIQAAVVGMLIIVGVLAIIWTLEQVIFNRRICLGLSCPLTLPGLLESEVDGNFCCRCVRADGGLGEVIDAYTMKCASNSVDGNGEQQ